MQFMGTASIIEETTYDIRIRERRQVTVKNPFPYSMDNKRYHTWNYHLQQKFGGKVSKVAIDGGFTCPNLDGTKGRGGCIYCSSRGSGDFAGSPLDTPVVQFEQGKEKLKGKWPKARYLPYFQAHSNTYAPVESLRKKFEPLLSLPDVVGLCVATRADCLPSPVLDYLEELSHRTYLVVELGLQSVFDQTGARINRCHTFQEFLMGFEELNRRGIQVCVHLINGLPGETREMMVESAKTLSQLQLHSLKIHLLYVLRGTALGEEYERHPFPLLSREEYIQIVCDQLEVLPPTLVIQRLTGDGVPEDLLGPMWSTKKLVVLNEIDKELVRRGSMQGSRYLPPTGDKKS